MSGAGDAEFAALFAARARHVRRVAYLLCGDWARAEDLAQTAFAKLYAAWPRLRDAQAAEAYLAKVLTRTFVDDNRRAWRREHPTADLPDRAAGPAPTDDRLVLLAALATVPPRQRACLVLRFFADCSVAETAQALGCTAGTVKSNTARGLDALRRVLGDTRAAATTSGGSPS